MDHILIQLQELAITCMGAAVTALCAYAFTWLRTYLGIKESASNETEIRNAAITEAGKLLQPLRNRAGRNRQRKSGRDYLAFGSRHAGAAGGGENCP